MVKNIFGNILKNAGIIAGLAVVGVFTAAIAKSSSKELYESATQLRNYVKNR